MMINRNLTSQIPFGYISAQALDYDIVNELQFGSQATEPAYGEALQEAKRGARAGGTSTYWNEDEDGTYEEGDSLLEERLNEDWQPDEPVHQGVYQGVKYATSWLGGALNVWILESPHITHLARRASPCVPGAAILDTLDGDVTGYDVPPEWRSDVS